MHQLQVLSSLLASTGIASHAHFLQVLEDSLDNVSVYIHSEGESLNYEMYWKENGELQNGKLSAQLLGNLVSGTRIAEDVQTVTIYANSVETMSGILKQVSAIRAWGSYVCFVKFEIKQFH